MNHLTKCSIYIEMYLTDTADQPLGVGTGFTVKTDQGHSFLVTNWHCVTGINPETNQALSTNEHKDPEFLDAHFFKKEQFK
ncbi:hypothetical protein [Chryseobacterium proteolyticum]|uniref:hypothetical protein n=1 Tax=Chryseobacterium proteolyticum TaxID=118127 RepID=UPI003983688B